MVYFFVLRQTNDFALGIYSGSISQSQSSDGMFHFDAGFAGDKVVMRVVYIPNTQTDAD